MLPTAWRFLLWPKGDVLEEKEQDLVGLPFPSSISILLLIPRKLASESQAITVQRNVFSVSQAMSEMSYLKLLGLVNKIMVFLIVKL